MRKISDSFLQDLKSGFLSNLMAWVHQDKDLDIEIRDGYINIYYKGYSLLKLDETHLHQYRVGIHPKFSGNTKFQDLIDKATTDQFLARIPSLKQNIIQYGKTSLEIEYEQMIIRANNYEPRNNSEYFIVDRQVVAGKAGRFDLTGFNWSRKGRRRGQEVPVCLFEVKFALNQDIQHVHEQLERYYEAIKDKAATIAEETQSIFRQKLELGLFNQPSDRLEAMKTLTFSRELDDFQFILIFVDYNPNSKLYSRANLAELQFAEQIRVFHTGFAMWGNNLLLVN